MNKTVSQIAWDFSEEPTIAKLFQERGIKGIEVAPTKRWERPAEATSTQIAEYRAFWEDRGVKIVAMQSLLFGQPQLNIFGSSAIRRETVDYMKKIIALAAALGAGALVFGSPKNRLKGDLTQAEAEKSATDIFRELGAFAHDHGTWLCIEANPPQYGCDFVTTTEEAAHLVSLVNTPGFGLHLDTAGMQLCGEAVTETVMRFIGQSRHLHFSAPFLEPVYREEKIPYSEILQKLTASPYKGWISIEMKQLSPSDNSDHVRNALDLLGG